MSINANEALQLDDQVRRLKLLLLCGTKRLTQALNTQVDMLFRKRTFSKIESVKYESSTCTGNAFAQLGTAGLENLGNTCYLNSAVQCLAHIDELAAYFVSGDYAKDVNASNPIGYQGRIAQTFADLLRRIYLSRDDVLTPAEFRGTVAKFNRQFAGSQQQDSQEFTAFLLDALHEDLNRVHAKPVTQRPDLASELAKDPDAVEKYAQLCWDQMRTRNDSVIVDLFSGLYKSTLVCSRCKNESVTFDPFMDLTLPMISGDGSRVASLDDCLRLFEKPDTLTGCDKWFCSKCEKHVEATKLLELWRAPDVLMVHLKRFRTGPLRSKINDFVSFPIVGLDLSGFVHGPTSEGSQIYDLVAVDNHFGTLNGGHYTAYARNPTDRKWYSYDDSTVRKVPENSVVSSAAYLLIYRRRAPVLGSVPRPRERLIDEIARSSKTFENSAQPARAAAARAAILRAEQQSRRAAASSADFARVGALSAATATAAATAYPFRTHCDSCEGFATKAASTAFVESRVQHLILSSASAAAAASPTFPLRAASIAEMEVHRSQAALASARPRTLSLPPTSPEEEVSAAVNAAQLAHTGDCIAEPHGVSITTFAAMHAAVRAVQGVQYLRCISTCVVGPPAVGAIAETAQ